MTFDHLDDPQPFVADDDLAATVKRRGTALRRRRFGVLGTTSSILVVVLLGVGFAAYERDKAHRIERLDLTANLDAPQPGTSVAGAADDAAPTDALNILVVGSDARIPGPDRPPEENLTDTMMIVRVDPPTRKVSVLSLPRDLWVAIPGHGNEKLNAAWALGGPALLIDTIKANFSIPIHHYLGVDGEGFRQLVDQAGGADLFVAGHLTDSNTGVDLSGPACVHLDGAGTLALVRSRHLSYGANGRRYEDITSDLGRIQRQQLVARVLAASILQRSLTPAATNQLLDTLVAGAILDTTWALKDMARLLTWARGLDLDHDLTMSTPPTSAGYEGQAAVLHLDAAAAAPVFEPFRGVPTTTTSSPPSTGPTTVGAPGATTSAPKATTPPTLAPGVPPVERWVTATKPDGTRCP